MRKLPFKEVVEAHDNKCVVFGSHFPVDFRIPTSSFLRHFLQSYHLGLNSVLYIACFVTLCKAYLGIYPFPSFFRHFFYFCSHKHGLVDYSCGDAMIYWRSSPPLQRMKFKEFFKKWEQTFFYVRSIGEGRDWVSLPTFSDESPNVENWSVDLFTTDMAPLVGRLKQLESSLGLMGADVVATFISRRVQPLQERPHRTCNMSGPNDLCQLSMVELPLHKVAARLNRITNFQLDKEEWSFGMGPFHCGNRAPLMFGRQNTSHPTNFLVEQEDSDAEDYESDGGGPDSPKAQTRQRRRKTKGTRVTKQMSRTLDAAPPTTWNGPREGVQSTRLEAGWVSPSRPGARRQRNAFVRSGQPMAQSATRSSRRPAHAATTRLERERCQKAKAAPTAPTDTEGPLTKASREAMTSSSPEAPNARASSAPADGHPYPPPKVVAPPAAPEVARFASDRGQRSGVDPEAVGDGDRAIVASAAQATPAARDVGGGSASRPRSLS
ncbi:hypothetical protein D1007_38905 [Hordeum vulgare]|nr:hypothetical protein D1007_38905 [Hordeum vulgare]